MKNIIQIAPIGLNKDAVLTIIIPTKCTEQRTDILERITYAKLDDKIPGNIDFLIVDDGSDVILGDQMAKKCKEIGISYMRLENRSNLYCAARARNQGAMHSYSPYIMFMDVDLAVYDGFYQDVLDEIALNNLELNTKDFISFAVIYLTKKGSDYFLQTTRNMRKKQFLQYFLENNEEIVEKFSTGTSVQVFNREYFLARGGNYEVFEGWGFEDLEFTCRLAHRARTFTFPKNFLQDYKTFKEVVEYRGFKSMMRLYGDITFAKGITLFHIWHEVDHDSTYMKQKARNRIIFEQLLKNYIEKGEEPEPLPDISAGNTLLFSQTHPAIYNREILPRYGRVFYEDENRFSDIESFKQYIREYEITRVIIQNPYSNELRRRVYNYLRENKIPYYVVERGALPDSMFFDHNGFNSDSESYHPRNWDIEISKEKRKITEDYITAEINGTNTLEVQPDRVEPRKLLKQLKINPDKKILFVPFQTYSDTVITYFCGQYVKTYDDFINLVQEVASNLPENWVLAYKKHPLSKNTRDIEGGICADECNIKDLLNICDAVLLINSGVGVLSMLWEKPVLYTGEIFYEHDAINRRVKNANEIIANLTQLFTVDREKVIRFLSFLINDFYCFGKFTTKLMDWSKESNMTITTEIDFYKINNIGKTKYVYDPNRGVKINTKSVLFDRYRFDLEYLTKYGNRRALFVRRPMARTKEEKKILLSKRWSKFINNPYQFFSDSRFIILRPLKYLFR